VLIAGDCLDGSAWPGSSQIDGLKASSEIPGQLSRLVANPEHTIRAHKESRDQPILKIGCIAGIEKS
jgi:hypothetical protein